ncbi:5-oxoprolinase subunit PxpA [Parasphingorhabdus sp.]|uniref:5-oxoprolinase subunit PxpA n=1 Tax=Parasphingorhabdus sp. TaxID=2709688 RepID=UPI003A9178E0
MTPVIDLNADLGEDESPEGIARDIEIMEIVSSCNIACGGHAGSPETMRTMLMAAKSKGVAAGAHPSYPDRAGFGRKSMDIPLTELESSLTEQLRRIVAIAADVGTMLTHIKPHGALYNDAQDNSMLSNLLVDMADRSGLALIGMAGMQIQKTATAKSIAFIGEAFVDRQYTSTGRLVSRSEVGAVISQEKERLRQGLSLAQGLPFPARDGVHLTVEAQTLCLHSDSDGALETAKQMRRALEKAGITIGNVR